MKISLITPAKKLSRAGNRTTARRWAHIFKALGHQVRVSVDYAQQPADVMVALFFLKHFLHIKLFEVDMDLNPVHN